MALAMCEVWHLVRRKNNAYPQILVYGRNSRTGRHTACPLLGVKRTSATHSRMSAFDPKRTLTQIKCARCLRHTEYLDYSAMGLPGTAS